MAEKTLRKEQLAVLNDLFSGDFDLKTVLNRHKVRKKTYYKWFNNEKFFAEFRRHLVVARLQHEAKMTISSIDAAAQLVELTKSQKPEIARKACHDIISSLQQKKTKTDKPRKSQDKNTPKPIMPTPLKPEVASRLLAALAAEKEIISKDIKG